MVLWASILIAITTAGILTLQQHFHKRAHNYLLAAELKNANDAAISEAIYDLNRITPHLVKRLDGSPVDWVFAGHRIEIRVQDEIGKVDLNVADRPLLRRVFIAGGADGSDADVFADRIMDWRERGGGRRLNGAKQDDYAQAGFSYGPREAPFLSVGEVALVLGMTDSMFERVAPAFTVYSEIPSVDDSVAPPLSLAAAADLSLESAKAVVAARNNGAFMPAQQLGAGSIVGHAFTISAEATEGALTVRRMAIVRLTRHAVRPEWIYRWE